VSRRRRSRLTMPISALALVSMGLLVGCTDRRPDIAEYTAKADAYYEKAMAERAAAKEAKASEGEASTDKPES
jgi:hypothetical protein